MCIGKASAWPRLTSPESQTLLTELSLLLAMANPASAACTQAGGKLEMVRTDRGEQGLCTMPSGVVCEEWEFFRGECPPKKKIKESDEPAKGKKST
jgi:putative hemolysin